MLELLLAVGLLVVRLGHLGGWGWILKRDPNIIGALYKLWTINKLILLSSINKLWIIVKVLYLIVKYAMIA